nr:hypothetical protein [Tanacetum cinerariifolium]
LFGIAVGGRWNGDAAHGVSPGNRQISDGRARGCAVRHNPSVTGCMPTRSVGTIGTNDRDTLWERACSRRGRISPRALVLEHHVPHGGVILQPVHRHVLAIAGQLLPAVRHFADEHEVRVHPGGCATARRHAPQIPSPGRGAAR